MKKKLFNYTFLFIISLITLFVLFPQLVNAAPYINGNCQVHQNITNVNQAPICASIESGDLGFQIPTLGGILTFVIRAFFVIAGLVALFYMLLGALAWITSGGDKDGVTAAREKIQAAVIGVILIVVVLAIIWTLEQVIFKRRICLGLSCPVTLPGLIETTSGSEFCCACPDANGAPLNVIDAYTQKCNLNNPPSYYDTL